MLNTIGIILQVIGAAWVVWASYSTRTKFARFSDDVNYQELGSLLNLLRIELRDQFTSQAWGFAFLLAGALCQLIALA